MSKSAIKKEVAKVEEKVEVAVDKAEQKAESTEPKKGRGRPRKTPTTTPVEPKATETAIKKTAMVVAKTIRKDGEKWNDAMKRANDVMKKEKVEVKKTTKSELDRLLARVRKNKSLMSELKGVKDLRRDAMRTAKPVGKRMSESGNVYYEYRANKTDRKTYGKYAFAGGGNVAKISFEDWLKKNNIEVYKRTYYWVADDGGGDYMYSGSKGDVMKSLREDYKKSEKFELGGSVVTDLAGHTGGSLGTGNKGMLDGFSNTSYTGLVGETGAMSSGEMFMSGGGLKFGNLGENRSTKFIDDNYEVIVYPEKLEILIIITNEDTINQEGLDNSGVKWREEDFGYSIEADNKTEFNKAIKVILGVNKRFADGGSVGMANQQVIDDASQGYVNYYLGEGASQGIYKNGGAIMNQYAGKTPENVWDMLSTTQRYHFLHDHKKEIESTPASVDKATKTAYKFLPEKIKMSFKNHIQMGQYAKGGGVRKVGNREYSYGRNWTNDHRHVNKGENHEVKYNRKGKFLGIFAGGGETYNEKASQLKGGVNYYSVDIDLENGDEVRDLTFKSLDKAKKEFLKYSDSMVYDGENIDDIQLVVSFKNGDYENIYLNKGGSVTNERKHVNKDEDYEVRYAKPRPTRKGYLGKRNFSRGGLTGESARVNFLREEFASEDLIDELKEKLNLKSEDVKNQDVIAFAYTNYGGSIIDKYAIEYFLENYPRNIVVEETSYNGKNAFVFGKPAKEWMEQSDDYILGFDDFESYYYEKENEDFIQGINYFIQDLKRNYTFNEEEVKDSLEEEFTGYFNVYPDGLDYNEQIMIDYLNKEGLIKEEEFAKGGGVRKVGNREYSTGRNWTNDHRHTNKSENHEVNYNRKRFFARGGSVNDDTPKIYVADLEAYNNGRLSGVWLDLTDYSDADELMDAINDFLKTTGGEEYAVHDYENLPSSMYSEYMGVRDFEEIYEMIDLAKENDLPLDVAMEIVSQFDRSALDEFTGVYDSEQDFAEQLVDDIGIQSFNDFQYYLEVSDTDRRLLSQDMADGYVDDIRDEDGGNRLIEEAGLDVEEYEEADSERQDEMLDEAREIVYDEYYNNYFEGLSDPYYFLVEEQGLYDAESFANANFVRVDYEKLADALEQDYTFVRHDGQIYVFNIR
jgi:antirestriction protein